MQNANGETLYAICAVIRHPNGRLEPVERFVHAEFANQAHRRFLASLPAYLIDSTRVMGVGPAVGVWAEETKDKQIVLSM